MTPLSLILKWQEKKSARNEIAIQSLKNKIIIEKMEYDLRLVMNTSVV